MGICVSKSNKKKSMKSQNPLSILPVSKLTSHKPPLEIKSSTVIRVSEERDSANALNPNKPVSRGSHPTKKKNLTSFNVTDCDVTYTNNNLDISPIFVPKSSYHEKMNFKIKKESDPNPSILPLHLANKSCFTHKTRDSRLISQENLFFLKKNLDDYFRNRPKEEIQPEPVNYLSSEPMEEPPVLNISVIELQSNEEIKNEGGVQVANISNKREDCRNQLILLTQEILKDSQESSFPKDDSDFKIVDNVLYPSFPSGGLSPSPDEEEMLRKYAKIWHNLSNCYQNLNLWTESLNCLVPLASLYWQLGSKKALMICQIDAYLVQIMLILQEICAKSQVLQEKSKEIQRISMHLCFLEEKLKNERNNEDLKPAMSFLRFFQGLLTQNFELCRETLKEFDDCQIVSLGEYQDLYNSLNCKEKSPKILTFLENPTEMRQELKDFVIDRVRSFKEKLLAEWERLCSLKIPYKPKEISKSLVKMGNLLRIWLDLPHHAIFFYESAYKFNPKCLKALFFIAITLRSIGKSPLALEFYSQAIKYNPNFVDCYFNSGNIYFEDFSDLKEAEKAYTKALLNYAGANEPPLVNLGRIYNLLAEVKAQNSDFPTAVFLNAKGIAHDLTYEENYHDILKNLKRTPFSGPFLDVFAWIVDVLSLDPSNKSSIFKLQIQKKRISKLSFIHAIEEKKELSLFYEKGNEEKFLKETLSNIHNEKFANELLVLIAERIFQELEELFTYVSSKENSSGDNSGLELVYQKLSVVFNGC